VAFDGVGEHAFVRSRIHAALRDITVGSGADDFQGLRWVMNAGEDDARGILGYGDQALQARNAIGIRNGEINHENVETVLGDLLKCRGHAGDGVYCERTVASLAKFLADIGLVLSTCDYQENVPGVWDPWFEMH
jgi:hypothetical protein